MLPPKIRTIKIRRLVFTSRPIFIVQFFKQFLSADNVGRRRRTTKITPRSVFGLGLSCGLNRKT